MTTLADHTIQQEIGRGSFATVFKAQKSDGTFVAIKSVQRSKLNRKLQENLETEIGILKDIVHPHIVQLYSVIKDDKEIHLIMEYCPMGDLSIFIRKRGEMMDGNKRVMLGSQDGGLHESVVRYFLGQLASALEFLRSISVIHRDLKPQNILLLPGQGRDQMGKWPILKLADFGFARPLLAHAMASTLCGSPLYMAPEILRGDRYDAKADLWSLGAILYELVTSRPPFRAQNHIELLRKIEKGDGWIRFPGDPADERLGQRDPLMQRQNSRRKTLAMPINDANPVPEDLKDLIRKLLKRNPIERISFEDFF
ncbi:kinase-like domain-containing protein, partial [Gorgonomyces haynaldii]